ncbi:MAG: AAA family ATPase [Promethearchaeota archaeon]
MFFRVFTDIFSFFFGSRRIGKTYLFFQIMKELIDKNNISKDQIVYLNFKHPFKFHSI